MKTILAILLITFQANAAQMAIKFCWDRSPDVRVVSYRLYVSRIPNAKLNAISHVDSLTNVATVDLDPGLLHHLAVTAVDVTGIESEPSNEIGYLAPRMEILRPGLIRFWRPINRANVDYILESAPVVTGPYVTETPVVETVLSQDTISNVEFVQIEDTAPSQNRFYRLLLKVQKIGCAAVE